MSVDDPATTRIAAVSLLANSSQTQIDEIPKPTIQQTILFRLPIWLFDQTAGRLIKVFRQGTSKTTTATADAEGTSSSPSSSSSSDSDSDEIRVEASIESAPNGKKPRWRGKKMGRSTR